MVKSGIGRRFTRMDADPERKIVYLRPTSFIITLITTEFSQISQEFVVIGADSRIKNFVLRKSYLCLSVFIRGYFHIRIVPQGCNSVLILNGLWYTFYLVCCQLSPAGHVTFSGNWP